MRFPSLFFTAPGPSVVSGFALAAMLFVWASGGWQGSHEALIAGIVALAFSASIALSQRHELPWFGTGTERVRSAEESPVPALPGDSLDEWGDTLTTLKDGIQEVSRTLNFDESKPECPPSPAPESGPESTAESAVEPVSPPAGSAADFERALVAEREARAAAIERAVAEEQKLWRQALEEKAAELVGLFNAEHREILAAAKELAARGAAPREDGELRPEEEELLEGEYALASAGSGPGTPPVPVARNETARKELSHKRKRHPARKASHAAHPRRMRGR